MLPRINWTRYFRGIQISAYDIFQIYEAERILIQTPATPIPIYFSFENDQLSTIYSEIQSSSEFLGASAILNAGSQVLHQFMVTGQQPTVEKKKLNVLESKLSGTEVDSKVILLTSKLDSFTPAFGLSRGANTGKIDNWSVNQVQ